MAAPLLPTVQQTAFLQQGAFPPVIPTMPKAPTLEEIERMHAEANRSCIPAIPSTAMSAEELEKRMLQENRAKNQANGTPPVMPGAIPPLMVSSSLDCCEPPFQGNAPRNPVALGLCPPIHPAFVPCFGPWLDVLIRRTQNLPPGCPPPPHFVLALMNRFGVSPLFILAQL